MFDHSKNVVVSGGSLTVVHGNSTVTCEGQHADYPTSSRAGIQGLKLLYDNIAAGAMHNSKERYDSPKCHPDTRKAVLSDITSWISDHSKTTCILWVSAPAGSGKSAILQQIAENFYNSGGLSASFFFSRTATKRNRETFLIATLASQIATSIPATKPLIERAIERDPSIFDRVLSEQMDRLVVYPLVYASLQPESGPPWPTLLVIDGLDECNGGKRQAEVLRILEMALLQLKSSLPTFYLLIASRPEPAIVAVFDDELSDITHRLVLDDSYHPDLDIATFLRSSFADIFRRRHARFPSMSSLPQPWPPAHVISFLVRKSSGQFIFAATVIRFIDVDRKIPTAQLQLILDICGSVDSSSFATNPFALLDELYRHVLKSSEETERAISIFGAIFYLNLDHLGFVQAPTLEFVQTPTPEFIRALLQLEPEDITMIFWDLHSIVHIPASDKDPIHFYHASLRDFFTDRHRSRNLYIDRSKARSFLLKMCIQTLTDFHGGSTRERTLVAVEYSRAYWVAHYMDGDKLHPGALDRVLEECDPETWFPLADDSAFLLWWNDFALLRGRFHGRCSPECSALCFLYTSVLDRYLVHRFQKHELPAVAAALMWLTLLGPTDRTPFRLGGPELILREAEWFWQVRTCMGDKFQFCYLFTRFLSNRGRSGNVFVGSAISITHFAQVCAQRAWTDILVLDRPFGSENWRLLVYLYDIMNLLIPGDAPYEKSLKLADEVIIQNIKMRIDDIMNLAKFVEATATEDKIESFESQMLRWRNTKTEVTAPAGSTMILSGEQSLPDEVGTPGHGKHDASQPFCGQEAPFADNRGKRRKIMTIDVMGSEAARRDEEVRINDGRDIEHNRDK